MRAGDDALAKEALLRKAEKEAERAETQKALQEQGVYVDQLAQALKALDGRLKDIKLRQGTLRAKARANKSGSPLSGKTSAFDDFDRMAGRIDAVEAEASLDERAGRAHRGVGGRRAQAQRHGGRELGRRGAGRAEERAGEASSVDGLCPSDQRGRVGNPQGFPS